MAKTKKPIYLDNAATTPIDPKVLKAMMPYLTEEYGNASSLHALGLNNRVAVDRAQASLAKFLGSKKEEVYFTSGATESDNLAIFGPLRALQAKFPGRKWQIIVSSIEHDAILEPAKQLAKEGVEVVFLPVGNDGLIKVEELKQVIKENTALVSVMYANNEVGTIEPIKEIGAMIAGLNKTRKEKIYFHTDATQALAYADCRVDQLGVDLLSLSGHKIYGPKGIGVLYLRQGKPFMPLIFGGHQQDNVRPGTYNVPGIVGLGQAIEILSQAKKLAAENKKIKELRDYLIKEIKKIPKVRLNGDLKKRTEGNASFIFEGVEGESVLLMLSDHGIAVSTGSACSSGSLEPSHVLSAMGIPPTLAHGSLRFSLGRYTTKADATALVRVLPGIIKRLRKMSPLS